MRVLLCKNYDTLFLTRKAIDRIIELTGDDISKYIFVVDGVEYPKAQYNKYNRMNPIWIQVYEELQEEFCNSNITLLDIPEKSNFYICHRYWKPEELVILEFNVDEPLLNKLYV